MISFKFWTSLIELLNLSMTANLAISRSLVPLLWFMLESFALYEDSSG